MAKATISNVTKAIRSLPKGSSFLVGVSGGIDSIVLLTALVADARFLRTKDIEVAHIDHGLRRGSKGDAAFVRKVCKKLKIKFHLKTLKPPKDKSINIEAWGRQERYSFFNSILKRQKECYLLTAHHANDVAETFLMRLFSDKDLKYGVVSLDEERRILRPFVGVLRSEIKDYAKKLKLQHREDETNEDTKYLRNRVRKEIIPVLEKKISEGVVKSLAHRSTISVNDWSEFVAYLDSLLGVVRKNKALSAPWLRELKRLIKGASPHLGARLIERAFYPVLRWNLGVERSLSLRDFIFGDGKFLDLASGIKLIKEKSALKLQFLSSI